MSKKAPLKIMFINVSYKKGGAGIAATRLYEELQRLNSLDTFQSKLDLRYLCIDRPEEKNSPDILSPRFDDASQHNKNKRLKNLALKEYEKKHWILTKFKNSRLGKMLRDLRDKLLYAPTYPKYGTSFFGDATQEDPSFYTEILKFKPDLIHLHWIISLLSIQTIQKIAQQIPTKIIWTTHDMWAYTGGCSYYLIQEHSKTYRFCEKWKTHCNNCPNWHSNIKEDLSFTIFKDKLTYLRGLDLQFVSPAQWARDHLEHSPIFKDNKKHHIPNAYNTEIFSPQTSSEKIVEIKNKFQIPLHKKIILFGNIYSRIKGGELFDTAIKALKVETDSLLLLSFGENNQVKKSKFETIELGNIDDEKILAQIYSLADIMVVPSIMDIGPSTAIEALLCGTPVVAFNAYGPAEFIKHKINGYLATPYKAEDLREGISYILDLSPKDYEKMSTEARSHSKKIFDKESIAKKYMEVYLKVLEEK